MAGCPLRHFNIPQGGFSGSHGSPSEGALSIGLAKILAARPNNQCPRHPANGAELRMSRSNCEISISTSRTLRPLRDIFAKLCGLYLAEIAYGCVRKREIGASHVSTIQIRVQTL